MENNGNRTALLKEFEHLNLDERRRLMRSLGFEVSDLGRESSTPESRAQILRELGIAAPVNEGDEDE